MCDNYQRNSLKSIKSKQMEFFTKENNCNYSRKYSSRRQNNTTIETESMTQNTNISYFTSIRTDRSKTKKRSLNLHFKI